MSEMSAEELAAFMAEHRGRTDEGIVFHGTCPRNAWPCEDYQRASRALDLLNLDYHVWMGGSLTAHQAAVLLGEIEQLRAELAAERGKGSDR